MPGPQSLGGGYYIGLDGQKHYHAPGSGYDPNDPSDNGAYLQSQYNAQGQNAARLQQLKGDMGRQFQNFGDPSQYMGTTNQSRANQAQALGMMQQSAMGNGPSVAAIHQQQGLGGAAMGQHAMMAGGNPLAARAGMLGGASNMAQATTAAGGERGAEQMQALGGYGLGAQQMREGDLAVQGEVQKGIAEQNALGLQQTAQNQKLAQGQLGGDLAMNEAATQAWQNRANLIQQWQANKNAQDQKYLGMGIGIVGSTLGMGA